ncbi:MAG: hypothetical protein ACOX0L_09075 [Natronincolaceae bacterium]|jgi:hypothetical protein|nr:hypothetical protein [Bacillota bacterium]NLK90434.1 hypothetical protein [Clostridiales bacterium]
MAKRLIIGVFIFLALGMFNMPCYANNTVNRPSDEIRRVETGGYFFEIIEPERSIITTDKNALVSFRASRDTDICIEVYHNSSIEKDKEKYILLYDPIDITVGALQRGWASVDLKLGLNKIQFMIKYKNGSEDSIERIINVMDAKEIKQLLQDVVNKPTLSRWQR